MLLKLWNWELQYIDISAIKKTKRLLHGLTNTHNTQNAKETEEVKIGISMNGWKALCLKSWFRKKYLAIPEVIRKRERQRWMGGGGEGKPEIVFSSVLSAAKSINERDGAKRILFTKRSQQKEREEDLLELSPEKPQMQGDCNNWRVFHSEEGGWTQSPGLPAPEK